MTSYPATEFCCCFAGVGGVVFCAFSHDNVVTRRRDQVVVETKVCGTHRTIGKWALGQAYFHPEIIDRVFPPPPPPPPLAAPLLATLGAFLTLFCSARPLLSSAHRIFSHLLVWAATAQEEREAGSSAKSQEGRGSSDSSGGGGGSYE